MDKKIKTSNNYTFDGITSRRMQFGYDYNKSVNGLYDLPDIKDDEKASDANSQITKVGKYKAIDTLDSFWFKSDGLIIPPNSNVRMEFSVDGDYLSKASFKTLSAAGASVGGVTIDKFELHPCFYINPGEVKPSFRLRFVGPNSFRSMIKDTDTAITLQYTVSPTITKATLAFIPQSFNADVSANATKDKWNSAYLFNAPIKIKTCQFKVGNVVYPQTPYNCDYGLDAVYFDYCNHTQQIAKDSGKEPLKYFTGVGIVAGDANRNKWGPIIVAPIVKNRSDPTNTLEVNLTFDAPGMNVYVVLTAWEEQAVDIAQTGNEIITTPTI